MIVVLYRTGIRGSEMWDLEHRDVNTESHAIVIRHGKGDKRRIVAIDAWGWKELEAWMRVRETLPAGKLICCTSIPSAGNRIDPTDVRRQFRALGRRADVSKRVAPHQFRHGHAVELWHEEVNVDSIQKQLGQPRLDVTANYLRRIDPMTTVQPISERKRRWCR